MDIRHKLGLQVLRIWSWDAERWVAPHCLLQCVESGGGGVPVCHVTSKAEKGESGYLFLTRKGAPM